MKIKFQGQDLETFFIYFFNQVIQYKSYPYERNCKIITHNQRFGSVEVQKYFPLCLCSLGFKKGTMFEVWSWNLICLQANKCFSNLYWWFILPCEAQGFELTKYKHVYYSKFQNCMFYLLWLLNWVSIQISGFSFFLFDILEYFKYQFHDIWKLHDIFAIKERYLDYVFANHRKFQTVGNFC